MPSVSFWWNHMGSCVHDLSIWSGNSDHWRQMGLDTNVEPFNSSGIHQLWALMETWYINQLWPLWKDSHSCSLFSLRDRNERQSKASPINQSTIILINFGHSSKIHTLVEPLISQWTSRQGKHNQQRTKLERNCPNYGPTEIFQRVKSRPNPSTTPKQRWRGPAGVTKQPI